MRYFPYAVAVLDLGATTVYAFKGQYRLALVWFFYACATTALAGVK